MVTGASDGIGKEAALTYARHGAKLILLGRSESKLKQVQQTIAAEGGKPATVFPYDLLTAQPKHYAMLQEELMKEVDQPGRSASQCRTAWRDRSRYRAGCRNVAAGYAG